MAKWRCGWKHLVAGGKGWTTARSWVFTRCIQSAEAPSALLPVVAGAEGGVPYVEHTLLWGFLLVQERPSRH